MDTSVFWNVIGQYNQNTIIIQGLLLVLIAIAIVISYTQTAAYFAKLLLGMANLFIGVVFLASMERSQFKSFLPFLCS